MEQETPPATLETIMAAITTINARLDDHARSIHQLQQPQRVVPPVARRLGPALDAIGEEEEEPPDDIPQHQLPQRPPPPQERHYRHLFERDHQRDRPRIREDDRNLPHDVKLTVPTFAGRIDPAAYHEWERRMEHLFEYYGYTNAKKVPLAVASFTDNALAWWERTEADRRKRGFPATNRWTDLKEDLRARYVPPNYQRELLKRYRGLCQGNRSVEEYFEEFELLRSRLTLEEEEESVISQFLDGLQEKIQSKVEFHPYATLQQVLHLAVQCEQRILKKATVTRPKPKPSPWTTPALPTPPIPSTVDKGKATTIESRFKSQDYRAEPGKSSNPQRTHEIVCYKCHGRGHMARDCPNKRTLILTADGYDSQDDSEESSLTPIEEEVTYAEEGELLVIQRALSAQPSSEEPSQRNNLFHTRCTIKEKVCHLIIDSGSCTNIASTTLVEKLGLYTTKHPRPYKLKWLNDKEEIKVSQQVEVPFTIGSYTDHIFCDVVPMEAGHLLLGRPWQYDRQVQHDGRANRYSLSINNKRIILAPLEQKDVRALQSRAQVSKNIKSSFYIDKIPQDILHLSCPKGYPTETQKPPDLKSFTPTLELNFAKGAYKDAFKQPGELKLPTRPDPRISQGKAMISKLHFKTNLLPLCAGNTVSWKKLPEEGGDDVGHGTGSPGYPKATPEPYKDLVTIRRTARPNGLGSLFSQKSDPKKMKHPEQDRTNQLMFNSDQQSPLGHVHLEASPSLASTTRSNAASLKIHCQITNLKQFDQVRTGFTCEEHAEGQGSLLGVGIHEELKHSSQILRSFASGLKTHRPISLLASLGRAGSEKTQHFLSGSCDFLIRPGRNKFQINDLSGFVFIDPRPFYHDPNMFLGPNFSHKSPCPLTSGSNFAPSSTCLIWLLTQPRKGSSSLLLVFLHLIRPKPPEDPNHSSAPRIFITSSIKKIYEDPP